MTRKEELKQLNEYVEKNGVTTLPPDERGPEVLFSAWKRQPTKKKRGRKKKEK